MKAYIIESKRLISPFADHVENMPVGGTTLRIWQTRLLEQFGFSVHYVSNERDIPSDEPRLITYDNVFFTRRGLKSFFQRWKKALRPPARFALPEETLFLKQFSDLQDSESNQGLRLFNLWLLDRDQHQDDASGLEILFREKTIRLPTPPAITGLANWEHPVTSSVCLHIRHWIHVLQMNLLSIQVSWVDQILAHPFWASTVLLKSLFGQPKNFFYRLAKNGNRIGKNVDIHPSAIVEGCLIGDNVVIGPQALVRGSIISDGVVLQERVNVAFCVIGSGSFVSKHSVVHGCASFENADLCMRGMQLCLVGKKAALTTRANAMDITPNHKIRVEFEGQLHELDMTMLGSCFGHEVFIGADVYIAPGRAIPNGIRIVSDLSKILLRIPGDLEEKKTYAITDGSLTLID